MHAVQTGSSADSIPPGKLGPSVRRMRRMTATTVTKKTARMTMSKRRPVDGRQICVPLHTVLYSGCVCIDTQIELQNLI